MGVNPEKRSLTLAAACRLGAAPRLAVAGSGGKTTALYRLARQLPPAALVTASTHLATWQISLADRHFTIIKPADVVSIENEPLNGVTLLIGPLVEPERLSGLDREELEAVRELADQRRLPLFIEADGSRQKPLKAPGDHEPPIPTFADTVVVTIGLSGIGKPLSPEWVHRPEQFARLSGLSPGEPVSLDALARVLVHPEGGLKNIPGEARRILLLNQADTLELREAVREYFRSDGSLSLLGSYHAVIIAALQGRPGVSTALPEIDAAYEPVAGILLAAGESRRFNPAGPGQPKQLLPWGDIPIVRRVALVALQAGLSPLVVVLGAYSGQVRAALEDLPVVFAENPDWQGGQSTSIRAGLKALPSRTGAAIFLLSDQPQVSPDLLAALRELHAATLSPLVAPLVGERRANPVLFDRITFPELQRLTGDIGGRALFAPGSPYQVAWLPWEDRRILLDIDTPEDYRRLWEMR